MDIENHPIPQDVTGFQFKLIGQMTVKEFAYLAAGCVLAYIIFVLPIFPFIKIPLALAAFVFGIVMAFIPIHGRPASLMISFYLKSLFTQDQYIYQKQGGNLSILASIPSSYHPKEDSRDKAKLESYLKSIHASKSQNPLDQKESVFLNSISTISTEPSPQLQTIAANTNPVPNYVPHEKSELQEKIDSIAIADGKNEVPQILTVEKEGKEKKSSQIEQKTKQSEEIEGLEKAEEIEKELEEAKKEEAQKPLDLFNQAHQKVQDLEKQLAEALSQKAKLEEEFLTLRQKIETQNKEIMSPSVQEAQKKETPNVRKIPNANIKQTGLIAPDIPNIVCGIVKNPRGSVIPNILIEVKDQERNPVRAFKTNPLGQFASATALPNGEYIIEIEDPSGKNKFDAIALTLNGQIIEPLEIISTDEREELRRSLFGKTG